MNGLIYPSPRNDCGVEIKDGIITDFWGWNFVDYRKSSRDTLAANSVILYPWKEEVLKGIGIQQPKAGDFNGSLRILGVTKANDDLYEQSYDDGRRKLMDQINSHPRVVLLFGSCNLDQIHCSPSLRIAISFRIKFRGVNRHFSFPFLRKRMLSYAPSSSQLIQQAS